MLAGFGCVCVSCTVLGRKLVWHWVDGSTRYYVESVRALSINDDYRPANYIIAQAMAAACLEKHL